MHTNTLTHTLTHTETLTLSLTRLTFGRTADGVVSEAPSSLFEVGAGRAPVPRGNGHQATPLGAAPPTGGRAGGPGTPVDGLSVSGALDGQGLLDSDVCVSPAGPFCHNWGRS